MAKAPDAWNWQRFGLSDLGLIKKFECALDKSLATKRTYSYDATESLALAANLYEVAADESPARAGLFNRGSIILAPYLCSGRSGTTPDARELANDITFASHYYMLREYLYYTYNAEGSIGWAFDGNDVRVLFVDNTIPRQFYTRFNDWLLDSHDFLEIVTSSPKIRDLLAGQPEWVETKQVHEACELIKEEVDAKLRGYFAIVECDEEIDLGGYSYGDFIKIFHLLLVKALYHRYHNIVNGVKGAVFLPFDEFIRGMGQDLDMRHDHVESCLADLIFDHRAALEKLDASHFSLYREGSDLRRVIMRPHHFALEDGIVGILRVVAQRRPAAFLERASAKIGAALVDRVKVAFERQGFTCRSNVRLEQFDPKLPDIDLLVISEEPTLGYVILVCEIKCPLPAQWAKDQLRALNVDSVSKAFKQVRTIQRFLGTDRGIAFLRQQLPDGGLEHFSEFVVVLKSLIITSDNSGMFFGSEPTGVVNYRTLERLLRRSDGDIAYILHILGTYNQEVDRALRTSTIETEIENFRVSYEVVTGVSVLDFPEVKWRNSEERHEMVAAFVADGHHPLDVFSETDSDHDVN